jgi:hypothetical protein
VKKNVGVDWRSDDVDGFKIGDPATIVTVSSDVDGNAGRAAEGGAGGANFVITARRRSTRGRT